jgi:transposase-like protein
MLWKESSVMDERLRFVARLLDGETMTEVCRDFGISRKTGYKIFDRYKEHGLEALSDRSRRPRCPAARTARRGDEAVAMENGVDGALGWHAYIAALGEIEEGVWAGEGDAIIGADGIREAALAEADTLRLHAGKRLEHLTFSAKSPACNF